MIKAIFYDLDGVLLDAIQIHFEALNQALTEVADTRIARGEEPEFNGIPTRKKLAKLVSQGRVKKEDCDRIWRLKQDLTVGTIKKFAKYEPSKKQLHEYTRSLGIKSVCVTNSITETTKLMLECTGQIYDMSFSVTNQMVNHPKPSSEPYVIGMVKLGVLPCESIIVEDSPVGLQSAEPTGAHIWQVKDADEVTKNNFIKFYEELTGEQK
jgi:beta-phosphoglucomutase-like phosphatase (HAD superfamily)